MMLGLGPFNDHLRRKVQIVVRVIFRQQRDCIHASISRENAAVSARVPLQISSLRRPPAAALNQTQEVLQGQSRTLKPRQLATLPEVGGRERALRRSCGVAFHVQLVHPLVAFARFTGESVGRVPAAGVRGAHGLLSANSGVRRHIGLGQRI